MINELHPWYWRKLPLEGRTGSNVFVCLFFANSDGEIATLLESPYPSNTENPKLARYSHVMHLASNIKGTLRSNDSKGLDNQRECTTIDVIACSLVVQ